MYTHTYVLLDDAEEDAGRGGLQEGAAHALLHRRGGLTRIQIVLVEVIILLLIIIIIIITVVVVVVVVMISLDDRRDVHVGVGLVV